MGAGCVEEITPNYLRSLEQYFIGASRVFLDGNLSDDSIETAIAMSRRAGIPVCVAPSTDAMAAKLVQRLVSLSVMVTSCQTAGTVLNRALDPSRRDSLVMAARQLMSKGVNNAVIREEGDGAVYATAEGAGEVRATQPDAVDPTGKDDAMTSAILFGLLNGLPLDDAVRLGICSATLTLGYQGSVVPDLSMERLFDQMVV
jgi:sugar/nucleoside kinase (ribokinase family)